MIGRLEGVLAEKAPGELLLDVRGVGYDVRVPLSTFFRLPDEGKTVRLCIHTHVREAAFDLYGFFDEAERAGFRLLLGISGVGPRLALAILSGLPVERLVEAVRTRELVALKSIPGVGAKTAERILVELRDKVERLTPPGAPAGPGRAVVGGHEAAASSALVNLGYSAAQAEKSVRQAGERLDSDATLELWIVEALNVAAR